MARNDEHALQPRTDGEGLSRRLAVLASKKGISSVLQKQLRAEFDAAGALAEQEVPQSATYRLWSSFSRGAQDRMWRVIAGQVDEDYQRISAEAGKVEAAPVTRIDPAAVPSYQQRAHIHGQPGGYMLERAPDDLAAGILYEAGGNIYALGQGIGRRDSKGQRLIAFIREKFPDFEPKRILEMGCSAGGQTADYAHAFPEAEIHAIDLAPAMLNYARARTALMGGKVSFHQQDAGNTGFEDGSFDLIISHNLFHEVDGGHMQAIADESYRLLSPSGLCIHQDVPIQTKRLDPFMRFISAWQRDHNDEPFWMDFANADLPALFEKAGFARESISEDYLKALDGPVPWYVLCAQRSG
jgi:ubiquinone/menaquinone biosynthesis C-methylase UbiE